MVKNEVKETEFRDDADFKVVTANLLRSGEIVYMIDGDEIAWTADIREASVFDAGSVAGALQRGEGAVAQNVVVGVYAVEITGRRQPIGAREAIRAAGGPTVKYGDSALDADYAI